MAECASNLEFIYYHEQLEFKSVLFSEYKRLYPYKPQTGFYLVCVKGTFLYCISKDFTDKELKILVFNIFDLEFVRNHNVKLNLNVNVSILDCVSMKNGWIWLRLINEECIGETFNLKLDEDFFIRSVYASTRRFFNRNTVSVIKSRGIREQVYSLKRKKLNKDELESLNVHCGVDLVNMDLSKHEKMRDLINQAEQETGLFNKTLSCCFLNYTETIAAVVGVPQRKDTKTVFSDCFLYVERGSIAEIYKLEHIYSDCPFVMQTKYNTILVVDPIDFTIETFVKVQ